MFYPGARCHDYGRNNIEHVMKQIHDDGFAGIQLAYKKAINGIQKFEDITPQVRTQTVQACKENDLKIAVLGVYIEPSLADEPLRKKNVQEFINSIPFVTELNAGCIGTETTNMEKQPGVTRKEAVHQLLRSLEEIMPVAEEHHVTVAVEPVFYHAMNTPEQTKEVLDAIRSPYLTVIFDPVNLLSAEDIPHQQAMWERALYCFGEKIAAVHIKGIRLDETGGLQKASLEDSAVNYPLVFEYLRSLNRDLFCMREEVSPEHAKQDAAFLKSLF